MKYRAPKALGICTAVGCALVQELDGMTATDWLATRPDPSERKEAPASTGADWKRRTVMGVSSGFRRAA